VYLVPRGSGEIVVGATSEDVGLDRRVTAGAVHDLLRAAIAVVPEVAELELAESLARFRPGTPDNAPLIGPGGVEGLLLATGHYRGGVLLAPVTAAAVVALVHGGEVPASVGPLSPRRFAVVEGRT
jgi:glycine oxidase